MHHKKRNNKLHYSDKNIYLTITWKVYSKYFNAYLLLCNLFLLSLYSYYFINYWNSNSCFHSWQFQAPLFLEFCIFSQFFRMQFIIFFFIFVSIVVYSYILCLLLNLFISLPFYFSFLPIFSDYTAIWKFDFMHNVLIICFMADFWNS